jgi:hypothetical protein
MGIETEADRGILGEPASTTIDLRKPGDVVMVLSSIANRWDPPPEIRQAICDQIVGAIEHYEQKMAEAKAEGRDATRLQRQLLKVVKLTVAMDAENHIAHNPAIKRLIGDAMPRRRYPERRKPRLRGGIQGPFQRCNQR